MNKNTRLGIKIILTLWICYHILTMIIMANGTSVVGRTIGQYFTPYANVLNLNTTWNFFSPDPTNTMYIEYQIYFENEVGDEIKPTLTEYFPAEKDQMVFDNFRRRYLYPMRFFAVSEQRLSLGFAPWLCRKYPEASRVKARTNIERIPLLDRMKYIDDASSRVLQNVNEVRLNCKAPQDEVSL
jgi:hypothetical protein